VGKGGLKNSPSWERLGERYEGNKEWSIFGKKWGPQPLVAERRNGNEKRVVGGY